MTFSKPSSILFAYKGIIPSAVMNAINNDFPNALDKTGDGIATSGGVTGEIDWKSGSVLQMLSGSTLALNSAILLNTGSYFHGNFLWNSTTNSPTISQSTQILDAATNSLIITAQNAYASASINTTGGGVLLQSGNGTSGGEPGELSLQLGNGLGAANVLVANTTLTDLYVDGVVALAISSSTINLKLPLLFNQTSSIGMSSSGGTGHILAISSGSTTLSGAQGGALTITTGSGPSGGGTLTLQTGSTGVARSAIIAKDASVALMTDNLGFCPLQVYNYGGSQNTQVGQTQVFSYFIHTQAHGSNVVINNFLIPEGTGIFVEVVWSRRDTTSSGDMTAQRAGIYAINSTGTPSAVGPSIAYNISGFAPASDIVGTSSLGILTLSVNGNQSIAYDWQIQVTAHTI